jgi:hypothetical protein
LDQEEEHARLPPAGAQARPGRNQHHEASRRGDEGEVHEVLPVVEREEPVVGVEPDPEVLRVLRLEEDEILASAAKAPKSSRA